MAEHSRPPVADDAPRIPGVPADPLEYFRPGAANMMVLCRDGAGVESIVPLVDVVAIRFAPGWYYADDYDFDYVGGRVLKQ